MKTTQINKKIFFGKIDDPEGIAFALFPLAIVY